MDKPTCVYKYCSAQRALQVLSDSYLYLCPPEELNDLYEFTISRLPSYTHEAGKFLEYVRWRSQGVCDNDARAVVDKMADSEIQENYEYFEANLRELNSKLRVHSGVTCFSAKFMDQRMWGTYGDIHRGVCIQFSNVEEDSKVHKHILPVTYTGGVSDDLLPRLLKQDGSVNVETLAREMYLTKTLDWRDEEEWRILMVAISPQSNEERRFEFAPSNVRRIFLGPRISETHRAKIHDVARPHLEHWGVLDVVPVSNEARFEYRGADAVRSYRDIEFWDDHRRIDE